MQTIDVAPPDSIVIVMDRSIGESLAAAKQCARIEFEIEHADWKEASS